MKLGKIPLSTYTHHQVTECSLCDERIAANTLLYALFIQTPGRRPEAVHPECALKALEMMVDKRKARLQGEVK